MTESATKRFFGIGIEEYGDGTVRLSVFVHMANGERVLLAENVPCQDMGAGFEFIQDKVSLSDAIIKARM
jgi:hypothetical protein